MIDRVRQEVIALAHTVVVKVGTNVMARSDGTLEPARMQELADQLHHLRASGRKVVLVSSGAIGAGVGRLGLPGRPADLRHLQACAAVGQSFLMRAWEDCLARHKVPTAQILLTASDFDNRARYLNVRNTILTLFEWDCLPIINENDTVSVAEIRFGDNDLLAAQVTNLLQAPLLVLLTVVDGLYSADPNTNPDAQLTTLVADIDGEVLGKAGATKSALGSGGMRSKLRAARLATVAGESVVMANGTTPGVLDRLFQAEPVGTLFMPRDRTLPACKRWLGYTVRPRGRLTVDAGARRAVCEGGRSLLAVGIVQVAGDFHKGDVVALVGPEGEEFGRGLSNYSAGDTAKLCGLQTSQIAEILGTIPYEEVVHRDNLVVTVALPG